MIPYNLQYYKPKSDPEEPIPEAIIKRAKEIKAQYISKDGQTAYRQTEQGIEVAYAPNFYSWWQNSQLPNEFISIDNSS